MRSEIKIYGINACLAVFKKRPDDVVRVYITEELTPRFSKILKHYAQKKIAYKIVGPDDLFKITESTHHEGVCFLTRKVSPTNFKQFLLDNPTDPTCVVALEHVTNPHNMGAILRVCAHFSVKAVLQQEPLLSGAIYRTAEGGAEWVSLLRTGELNKALIETKKKGFRIYGTSSHTGTPLPRVSFAPRSVILFGSESIGLSKPALQCCDEIICIPHADHTDSLNVSCAASVILYEVAKQRIG